MTGTVETLAKGKPRLDGETTYVPSIGTSLTEKGGGKEIIPTTSTHLVDDVTYENLRPGIEYEMAGRLVYSSGEPVIVGGHPVEASTTFTPTKSSGSVSVTFTLDTTGLVGLDLVAFESLKVVGETQPVATHEDPHDPGQTVKVLGINFYVEKIGLGTRVAGAKWELRGPDGTVQVGVVVDSEEPVGSVVRFEKVVPGDYELVETHAPDGYELLAEPVPVNIASDGTITIEQIGRASCRERV